jgi:hypothetical protein
MPMESWASQREVGNSLRDAVMYRCIKLDFTPVLYHCWRVAREFARYCRGQIVANEIMAVFRPKGSDLSVRRRYNGAFN